MATPSPLDPTAMWRDLVSQWEKGINEVANRAMTSEEFNRGMHGGLGVSLTAQKALGDALGRYLTALNLPTRNEITALGDRLQSIEERLIQIAAMLEQAPGVRGPSAVTGGPSALPPSPRRTKRPPPRQASPQPSAERQAGPGTSAAEQATASRTTIGRSTEPTPPRATRARAGPAAGRRVPSPSAADRPVATRRKSKAAP